MKPIILTPNQIKLELKIIAIALIVAMGLNCYSIIKFDTSWTEMYSQIGYVLLISTIFYLLSFPTRGIILLISHIAKNR